MPPPSRLAPSVLAEPGEETLHLRGILMSGEEYAVAAAAAATVADLARHFEQEVGVAPPHVVSLLLGTSVLSRWRQLQELFSGGEVHEVSIVVTDGSPARELLEAALDDEDDDDEVNERRFLACLEAGAAVTATMQDQDMDRLGHVYSRRGRRFMLLPGSTALHVAALLGWAEGCRRALRAPGGEAAAEQEASACAMLRGHRGRGLRATPRKLFALSVGCRESDPAVVAVFGTVQSS